MTDEQLYTLDGKPFHGKPDGHNAKGYPYVIAPTRTGGKPTHQRLYTAEHLKRRAIEIEMEGRE